MVSESRENEEAKEAIREAVQLDRAAEIAPFLYNPRLSEEQNAAEGRWIRENTTFDDGFIWDRRFLSLLHLTAMYAAKNCAELLLASPYSWSVDQVDGDGKLPIYYAFKTNVPSFIHLFMSHSRKICTPDNCDGNSFHLMLWPRFLQSEYAAGPFCIILCKDLTKAIFPWQKSCGHHLECSSPFALWFEIAMASLPVIPGDFWTGSWEYGDERPFWPCPRPKPGPIPYHDEACDRYPHCLDQLIARNGNQLTTTPSSEVVYRLVLSIWAFHTLTERVKQSGIEVRVSRPPSLKRLCRARIRRRLFGNYVNDRHDPEERSYYHLVHNLPIRSDMKEYLLYSDLWPTYVNVHSQPIFVREAEADPMGNILFQGEETFGFDVDKRPNCSD